MKYILGFLTLSIAVGFLILLLSPFLAFGWFVWEVVNMP